LQELKIISDPNDILDWIQKIASRNPKFNLHNKPNTNEQDAAVKGNWLLNKYIRAVFHVLEDKEPDRLKSYVIDETNNMTTTLKLPNTGPNVDFQSKWEAFKTTIRS
jgi:hypothetical protein